MFHYTHFGYINIIHQNIKYTLCSALMTTNNRFPISNFYGKNQQQLSVCLSSFLDFEIRSFMRYFVQMMSWTLWAKYLVKLRITKSKNRGRSDKNHVRSSRWCDERSWPSESASKTWPLTATTADLLIATSNPDDPEHHSFKRRNIIHRVIIGFIILPFTLKEELSSNIIYIIWTGWCIQVG